MPITHSNCRVNLNQHCSEVSIASVHCNCTAYIQFDRMRSLLIISIVCVDGCRCLSCCRLLLLLLLYVCSICCCCLFITLFFYSLYSLHFFSRMSLNYKRISVPSAGFFLRRRKPRALLSFQYMFYFQIVALSLFSFTHSILRVFVCVCVSVSTFHHTVCRSFNSRNTGKTK